MSKIKVQTYSLLQTNSKHQRLNSEKIVPSLKLESPHQRDCSTNSQNFIKIRECQFENLPCKRFPARSNSNPEKGTVEGSANKSRPLFQIRRERKRERRVTAAITSSTVLHAALFGDAQNKQGSVGPRLRAELVSISAGVNTTAVINAEEGGENATE